MNDFTQCPTDGALGLLALLIKSGRSVESELDNALASVGLTFVKWLTLDALARAEAPFSLGMLADHLNCTKSNVTQLADSMESDGVVRRVHDSRDRRSTVVEITEPGLRMQQDGKKVLESATHRLLGSLNNNNRITLRTVLEVFTDKEVVTNF